MQNVDTISNIRRSETRWRLDALLVTSSTNFHATDQRDKVYGLLGLAAESQDVARTPDALRPDYDLDVVQVYEKVASFIFWEYKSLSTLTLTSGVAGDVSRTQRKQILEKLPSWVPNWCDFAVRDREIAKGLNWITYSATGGPATLGFPEHYNASAQFPASLSESQDQSVLRLSGLRADSVARVILFDSKTWPAEEHVRETPILQFWEAAISFLSETNGMDLVSSFIYATTAKQHILSGKTAEQIQKDGSAYLRDILLRDEHQELLPASHRDGQDIISLLRSMSIGGSVESYASLAGNFCFNRSFIITANARMGIGPTGTRIGDVVTVLFGGSVPYVLRKQRDGYLFIGESYIHGLMDGEAIQRWQQGALKDEIFQLR